MQTKRLMEQSSNLEMRQKLAYRCWRNMGFLTQNLLKALTENNNIPDESVSTPFKQITFKKKKN
jgi:hypothetical protein